MCKPGDIVNIKGWTSNKPRARLLVLAVHDGYTWLRMERPVGKFRGAFCTVRLADLDHAGSSPPSSGKSLPEADAALG